MLPNFGPVELILILVIVTMLFGVGKLPEVFGAVGRGIKEFRKNSNLDDDDDESQTAAAPDAPAVEAATVTAQAAEAPAEPVSETPAAAKTP